MRFPKCASLLALSLILLCGSLGSPSLAQQPDADKQARRERLDTLRKTLRARGFSPDLAGVRGYFAALAQSDDDIRKLNELIEMLGADQFRVRESATTTLLTMAATQPQLVNRQLREALESPDEEIRFRALWLLARSSDAGSELLTTALHLIEYEPLPGLAREMLILWPYCQTEAERTAFSAALRKTASPGDRALLLSLIERPAETVQGEAGAREPLQIAAVECLRELFQKECVPLLKPHLAKGSESLRLAVALAVIDFDPLPAVETLIDLLTVDDPRVCDRALNALRQVSGQDIWMNAFGSPEERLAGAKQWQQWYALHGKTAKLRLPLDRRDIKQQRLLFALFNPNKIMVCTLDGKLIQESEEPNTPSGCAVRPNGNRVIAEWSTNGICEVNAEGKIIKRQNLGSNPNGLDLLPNGNVLVALFNAGKVVETDINGKPLWELDGLQSPSDIRRMPNGNTLVAQHGSGRLIELDAKRQTVWSIGGLTGIESGRPLANGNFLVGCRQGAVEYDRKGKVVWRSGHKRAAYDAVFLDNGNVLVADKSTGVFEYTRDGKLVRQHDVGNVRRICYY